MRLQLNIGRSKDKWNLMKLDELVNAATILSPRRISCNVFDVSYVWMEA